MSEGIFGISKADEAHIMGLLRDTIYTNKKLAVLREYGTNAWDAHRMVGKGDVPIRIALPTQLESVLVIRDYGPGMDEEDVYNVYTQYGASTKRGSNVAVGFLGIGSKSAFAYNDSFTIISYNGGMKKVYSAVLDESNKGKTVKLHEEPCGDETGMEIRIPVRPQDIPDFQREAKALFPFFKPHPVINMDMFEPVEDELAMGFLRKEPIPGLPNWIAVMGCVPYRLRFDQIEVQLKEANLTWVTEKLKGGLYFDIGEVDTPANREDLEYTDRTKTAILDKLQLLAAEAKTYLIQEVRQATSGFDRRATLRRLIQHFGIKCPDEYKKYRDDYIQLYRMKPVESFDKALNGMKIDKPQDLPTHFRMYEVRDREISEPILKGKRKGESRRKWVKKGREEDQLNTRDGKVVLLMQDTDKPLKGYYIPPGWRLLRKNTNSTWAEVEAEVEQRLLDIDFDGGVEFTKLSSRTYDAPTPKVKSKKHTSKYFKLKDSWSTRGRALSDRWDIVDLEVDPKNVFVIINRFEAAHGDWNNIQLYQRIQEDRKIWEKLFKAPFPDILGLKTTLKKPIRPEDVEGTFYLDWFAAEVEKQVDANPWLMKKLNEHSWRACPNGSCREKDLELLAKELGPYHLVVHTLFRQLEATTAYNKLHRKGQYAANTEGNLLGDLCDKLQVVRGSDVVSDADVEIAKIFEQYPMLRTVKPGERLRVFSEYHHNPRWGNDPIAPTGHLLWIQYIKTVDLARSA
jgi:hypothetical protein